MAGRRNINMTEGVIWKQLVAFAFPMMLTNLLQQLYNTADTLVVGRFVGSTALAAVGGTGIVVFLIVGFFMGLATGAGVIVSQYYGAGEYEALEEAVHTSIALAIVSGLVLTVLGYIVAPGMLRLINTPDNVIEQATLYLRILFGGMIFGTVYNLGAGILRAVGDSKRPLYYLIFSGAINVALNLVLVLVAHLGVAGVAIATVASQLISALLVLHTLTRVEDTYRLTLKHIRFNGPMLKRIVRLGIPAGLQSMAFSLSNILIQSQINVFGSDAMAGQSAGQQIANYIYMPLSALSMTVTTFIGQNVGAKKWDRVRKGTGSALLLGAIITAFMSALAVLFREPLVSLYTTEAAVIPFGITSLAICGTFYLTYVPTDILGGVIRGSGNTVMPMIITLISICVFRIIWIAVALRFWHEFFIVLLCYPITWGIASAWYSIYYWRCDWSKGVVPKG